MPLIATFLLVYLFGLCMPLIVTFLLVYIFWLVHATDCYIFVSVYFFQVVHATDCYIFVLCHYKICGGEKTRTKSWGLMCMERETRVIM